MLEQLGGKQIVMQHLGHEDPNVRYEALLAVQKLMVHNWLVWHMRLYCLIPPIALRCRSITTLSLYPTQLMDNNYFKPSFNQNFLQIFKIKLCFFFYLSKKGIPWQAVGEGEREPEARRCTHRWQGLSDTHTHIEHTHTNTPNIAQLPCTTES